MVNIPSFVVPFYLPIFSYQFTEIDLQSPELAKFLKEDEKFDICILELFMGEALLVSYFLSICYVHPINHYFSLKLQGVAEQAGCSIIQYTTFDSYIWSDNVLGK